MVNKSIGSYIKIKRNQQKSTQVNSCFPCDCSKDCDEEDRWSVEVIRSSSENSLDLTTASAAPEQVPSWNSSGPLTENAKRVGELGACLAGRQRYSTSDDDSGCHVEEKQPRSCSEDTDFTQVGPLHRKHMHIGRLPSRPKLALPPIHNIEGKVGFFE